MSLIVDTMRCTLRDLSFYLFLAMKDGFFMFIRYAILLILLSACADDVVIHETVGDAPPTTSGVMTPSTSVCGNRALEAGEECDGETLCAQDCTWLSDPGTNAGTSAGAGAGTGAGTDININAGTDINIDAGTDSGTDSGTGPIVPSCGNGILERGEECDGEPNCGDNCRWVMACTPIPPGHFWVGSNGYYSDGQGFCWLSSWEDWIASGGPSDPNQAPRHDSLPECMVNDGTCVVDDGGGTPTPTVTHETEFITWNLFNNAGCVAVDQVAKWTDRNNGPGPLSIQETLQTQSPAILALQEDGKLAPNDCNLGVIKDIIARWLTSTHDVVSTDHVGASVQGERYGVFFKRSKYRAITSGYQRCYHGGAEVRGFLWVELDLVTDNSSNHFYVLNTHFKARSDGEAERISQAQCVLNWVRQKKMAHPNRAHFLMGDLNSGPNYQPGAFNLLTGSSGLFDNTSGALNLNTHGSHWIDHVLGTKSDFTNQGYQSWTVGAGEVERGGRLSDHLGLRTRIGHVR